MPSHDTNITLLHSPEKRKFLPKFSGSPFGDFPSDYNNPMETKKASIAKAKTAGGQAVVYGTADQPVTLNPNVVIPPKVKKAPKSLSVKGPPKAGAFQKTAIPATEFRRFYERGDLPVAIQHRSNGRVIRWKVDQEKLDYHHYLPIFFDGLRELEEPYKFIASQGCYDLLEKGGAKILPTIPQLIIPLKTALNSRDPEIVCAVLKVMQKLVVSGDLIGEALVPYYRQLLPVLNLFRTKNSNTGDGIEYGQRNRNNLGDLVLETLQLLETHGGEDAFINIKYMIPTYESCVLN